MHPYIKHLLEDIKNAERKENDNFGYPAPTTFEEEMEEMKHYLSGEGERPLSYFTGLEKEDFPPSEQLSIKDMESVLQAYDNMLETWNAVIIWPENMPIKSCYEFLLKFVLGSEFMPVDNGTIHFDFCTGYAPECDWGKYCSCLEYWKDDNPGK